MNENYFTPQNGPMSADSVYGRIPPEHLNSSAMAPPPQKNYPPKKKKKKRNKFLVFLKKLMTVIATTLLSLFLVMIITGTIVTTALTVYVLEFMKDTTSITLQELESGSDTFFYGYETDENGEEKLVVLHRVKTDVQRIPVDIERIPQHVRDAFVYTEDERFYSHDGVDYKRTFSAFLNMFLHFYDTEQGGSTITQQLVKNLTGDKDHTPQRKIREIFTAMQLEKTYTKDEILEEYLNFIGFGGAVNGIQLASIEYFGKNVEELSTAEAAVLAAIPKSPEEYGPYTEYTDINGKLVQGRAVNRDRQEYVLYKLYENGAISFDEYQECLNTPLVYRDSNEYKALHPEEEAEELEQTEKAYSWEVDAIYHELIPYFMEKFELDSQQDAINEINKGGYKVYTTIDRKMQDYVVEKFKDANNLFNVSYLTRYCDTDNDGKTEEYIPHAAFVAMNYDGSIRATVGQWGEKKGSLVTNYAETDRRPIGSTVKPITSYGLALEKDTIHWGSVYSDTAIKTENGKPWPYNYSGPPGGGTHFIYYLLQQSFNTVPAQLCRDLTTDAVFEFATKNMGMKLDPLDNDYAPLAIGQMRYGLTLKNLVNAYIPYGNEGIYNEAHIVSRIEDSNKEIIYENNGNPHKAVSDETAWVMNRLMKNIVDHGTGTGARLSSKVVVGKTGTTENWWDQVFVGLTPDFVSGVTVGYDIMDPRITLPSNFHGCDVWKTIIGEYAQTEFADTQTDFEPVSTVIASPMCSISGMIAGPGCPHGITGYWKSTNAPYCSGGHYVAPPEDENGEGGDVGGGDIGGGDIGGGDVGGGDIGGGDVGGGDIGGGDVGGGDIGGGDIGGGEQNGQW
ncbi:MAG: hypothetical protein E7498_06950 [Ruminococcus sp.]|nr:hypothetical protein [Ruminococcus sp.]